MTTDIDDALDKLRRYAHARDRSQDREPRIISITDDMGVALLQALEIDYPKEIARLRETSDRFAVSYAQIITERQAWLDTQAALEAMLEKDDLGPRAARLVAEMLRQAGRYLTGGYGEINEVLIEARKRGWLEPVETTVLSIRLEAEHIEQADPNP